MARDHHAASWPADHRLVYVADLDATPQAAGLVLELGTEHRTVDGSWGPTLPFTFAASVWLAAPDPVDRQISEMLLGSARSSVYGQAPGSGFVIGARGLSTTLRKICDTGRLRARSQDAARDGLTLRMDNGAPWRLALRVSHADGDGYALDGHFVRPQSTLPISEPWLVHAAGFLVSGNQISVLDHGGAFALITDLRGTHGLSIGPDPTELLDRLYALPRLPELVLPSDVTVIESHVDPVSIVTIGGEDMVLQPNLMAPLTLEFLYGAVRVNATSGSTMLYDRSLGVVHHRRWDAEHAALSRLRAWFGRPSWSPTVRKSSTCFAKCRPSGCPSRFWSTTRVISSVLRVRFRWKFALRSPSDNSAIFANR